MKDDSMTTTALGTAWEHGRFDAVRGPGKILFGRMYEDVAIEHEAFAAARGDRVFCIASAGCTAMALSRDHEVVACDINPVQLAYAERRIATGEEARGMAERLMDAARFFAPLVGWTDGRLRAFLEAEEPTEQLARWRALDTRRFRWSFDALLSVASLRRIYASAFLDFLPTKLGAVMRGRLERAFARHPNGDNPYARLLLLGERAPVEPPRASAIELVQGDAAGYLEQVPAGSLHGFTLSNILDGAEPSYRARLFAAVQHAAAPGAMVVLRSFGEPDGEQPTNRAGADRSMLWGIVDVRPAADL